MNSISVDQNSPNFMNLLRAKSRSFSIATRLKTLSAIIALVIPAIGIILGYLSPSYSPYIASLAVLSIVDAAIIRRTMNRYIEEATVISEQFDTELYQLTWNGFLAKRPIDPERIHKLSSEYKSDDGTLKNWYIGKFDNLEIEKARFICQRTNLHYDKRLRNLYCGSVIGFAILLFFILFAIAIFRDATLLVFITGFLAPAVPYLSWCIAEWQDHNDIAEFNSALKETIDDVFERISEKDINKTQLNLCSRQVQDAIFHRRLKNPVILPLFYRFMRKGLEIEAEAGADVIAKKVT